MASADDRRFGGAGDDVWAQAVAEDAKQQAREARERTAAAPQDAQDPISRLLGGESFGSELGPIVDEVRRIAETVGDRLQKVQRASDALGAGAQGLEQLTAPLREKHPEVYRHLAAAGGELLAAYRAAVSGQERRWTDGGSSSSSEHIDLD